MADLRREDDWTAGDLVGVANIIADAKRYDSIEDCARAALQCAIQDNLVVAAIGGGDSHE